MGEPTTTAAAPAAIPDSVKDTLQGLLAKAIGSLAPTIGPVLGAALARALRGGALLLIAMAARKGIHVDSTWVLGLVALAPTAIFKVLREAVGGRGTLGWLIGLIPV